MRDILYIAVVGVILITCVGWFLSIEPVRNYETLSQELKECQATVLYYDSLQQGI